MPKSAFLLGKRCLRQRPPEKKYNILSILTIFAFFWHFLQKKCIFAGEKAPAAAPAGEEIKHFEHFDNFCIFFKISPDFHKTKCIFAGEKAPAATPGGEKIRCVDKLSNNTICFILDLY